ncbi:MAG: hypothetical protein MHM6MM_006106 [Cercozoa sp. M6MM]
MWRLTVLAAALLVVCTRGYTAHVSAGNDECFFELAEIGERFWGSYSVSAGGSLDIGIKVYGPDQQLVYEADKQHDGTFAFIASQNGQHKVCFDNSASAITSKTISFDFFAGDNPAAEAVKSKHLTPLELRVRGLARSLKAVKDEQHFLKVRERTARNTNESTNARVLWWSVFDFLLVGVVGVANALLVRSMFTRNGGKGPTSTASNTPYTRQF